MANATIRVNFSDGAGGLGSGNLSAEIDSRPGGLNGGRTSFQPGDDVWILVQKTPNVVIDSVDTSAGAITAGAAFQYATTEDVNFEGVSTSRVSGVADSLDSYQWFGRNIGVLTLAADSQTLNATVAGVAVARVTYTGTAYPYKLSSPASINGETTFSIAVVISGHSTGAL
jgi:hypothetical protein